MNESTLKPPYDAIVLAGGASRRFGSDKLGAVVDGSPMLDRVLSAVAGAETVVGVGPPRPTAIDVTWCREEPPGSGPANGLAVGLEQCTAPYVVVLAGDLPYVSAATVARLLAAAGALELDGVRLLDDGQPQHLCSAWRRDSLQSAVRRRPDWSDASVRTLLEPLVSGGVDAEGREGADVDRPEDLRSGT